MSSTFLKTIVWKAGTVSATFTRDISSVQFKPANTYKKSKEIKEELIEKIKDYCKQTGIDDLGAEKAVVSGPAHMPQKGKDDKDPWERLTVEIRDPADKAMKLKDPSGETFDRIHIATDPSNWHKKGHFKKA